MRQIRISEEVFELIQKEAVPFEDTPDTALRRVFQELYTLRSADPTVKDLRSRGQFQAINVSPFKPKESGSQKEFRVRRVQKEKPTSFVFQGKVFKVRTWIDVLRIICNLMAKQHPDKVERFLDIRDRKPHFSYNRDEVNKANAAREVGDTGIYGNGCLNSDQVKKVVRKVLHEFGYSPDSIRIV